MEKGRKWKRRRENKIHLNQARMTEEAVMINEVIIESHAYHYRWSSTCCSASERVARLRPVVLSSRTCSRTDYPPVAVDRPMPFAAGRRHRWIIRQIIELSNRALNHARQINGRARNTYLIGRWCGTEQVHDRLVSIVGWRTEERICARTTRWGLYFCLRYAIKNMTCCENEHFSSQIIS